MRWLAAAAGALFLAGGLALADGPGDESSPCYSYREARAKWPGAYLTWRYDDKKWQCWSPRGAQSRSKGGGYTQNRPGLTGGVTPRPLPQADDIAPEFPQPADVRIEQPPMNVPWPHPGGLGWVWESKEPFQPKRIGDDVPVFSTFQPGEEPDVWPSELASSRKINAVLPTVAALMMFLMGGAFVVVSAVAVEASDSARSRMRHFLLDRIARARSYLPGHR